MWGIPGHQCGGPTHRLRVGMGKLCGGGPRASMWGLRTSSSCGHGQAACGFRSACWGITIDVGDPRASMWGPHTSSSCGHGQFVCGGRPGIHVWVPHIVFVWAWASCARVQVCPLENDDWCGGSPGVHVGAPHIVSVWAWARCVWGIPGHPCGFHTSSPCGHGQVACASTSAYWRMT